MDMSRFDVSNTWPMWLYPLSGYPSVRYQSVLHACTKAKHKRPKISKAKRSVRASRFSNQVIVYQWTSWCPRHQVSLHRWQGFSRRKRYKYAMVFVDHYSDFSYVHLMQSQSAEEASSPKQSLRITRWKSSTITWEFYIQIMEG
jgi:hypothetical protein